MPLAELARWLVAILLAVVLVAASISDIRTRKIPNWTVLAVFVLFLPWAFLNQENTVLSALAACLGAFLITLPMYFFRVLGAGDSKFLAAVSLFAGLEHFSRLLLFVALAGGVMAIASLVSRPTRAVVMFQMRGKGDFGRGIPYGVAIAIGTTVLIGWPLIQRATGQLP
jgi:prepilin peptidase CpaA